METLHIIPCQKITIEVKPMYFKLILNRNLLHLTKEKICLCSLLNFLLQFQGTVSDRDETDW